MPKLVKSQMDQEAEKIKQSINVRASLSGMQKKDIIKMLGMSGGTFFKRLNDPKKFTIEELYKIATILHTDIYDLIRGISL